MIDKTSVMLAWSAPSSPNGIISEYQIIYYGYKEEDTSEVNTCMDLYLLCRNTGYTEDPSIKEEDSISTVDIL